MMRRNNMYQQQYYNQQQLQQQTKPKTQDKQIRMSISFKADELWLYEHLQSFSCPSGIIKDILKVHFEEAKNNG